MNKTSKYFSPMKTSSWGILWIIGAVWFWYSVAGNPFDELELILNATIINGYIENTWEDFEYGDDGRENWYHTYSYSYILPNGRKYSSIVKNKSGRLKEEFRDIEQPIPIQVEYLPHSPNVSRIKGSGNTTFFEWLWRKIGFGGLLLLILISPGFIIIRKAIKEIKEISK